MGFGLFNSESSSKTYNTTNNTTDSNNRTRNQAWNLSESGNTTIQIPSQAPAVAEAAGIQSFLLPIFALGVLALAALLILRR